jgi:ATP-binding cassette subfamily B (MDR/TAP) protein 1
MHRRSCSVRYIRMQAQGISFPRSYTRFLQFLLSVLEALRKSKGAPKSRGFPILLDEALLTPVKGTANAIQGGLSEFLGMTIQCITELVAALIIAFIESWKLTLVMTTLIVGLIGGQIIIGKLDTKLQSKLSDCYKQASSMVEEALGSIRSITALGAQPKILQKYIVYLEQAKSLGFRRSPVVSAQYSFTYAVLLCAYALAYYYGIHLFQKGEIKTGGRVVVVILCVNYMTNALWQLIPAVGMVIKAKVATKTIMETIERKPDMERQSKIASVPSNVCSEVPPSFRWAIYKIHCPFRIV